MYTGNYILSALCVAMNAVNGGKAKYVDKPIQLFEFNDEEKKHEKDKAIAAFLGWAKGKKTKLKGKEVEDG